MIEKTLKTTSGRLRVAIPENLNEVTLGQMIALQEKPDLDDLDAISILANVPVGDLRTVRNAADFAAFTETIMLLSHQMKYLYNSNNIPQSITFTIGGNKTKVKVISDLALEPAGAYFAAREIIGDEIKQCINQHGESTWQEHFNPSLKACAQVLAHYFFCRATGKPYNEYQAEEFVTEIKKLRVTEALPICKHFFTGYPAFTPPRTSYFQRLNSAGKESWNTGF